MAQQEHPDILQLQTDDVRVRFAPHVGATITDFSCRRSGRWVPLMRPGPEPLDRSSNGSFLMAPYSNRIRDGRFTFQDTIYQLRYPEKHSIHGDVRDREWSVIELGPDYAVLEFRSSRYPDFNFPFPLDARLEYRLDGATFRQSLTLINAGAEEMPAGCGFHPYFNRSLIDGDEVAVAFAAQTIYPYSGEVPLPDAPPRPVPSDKQFLEPRPLPDGIDHCFGDWSRSALIRWSKSAVELRIEASALLGHAVLFSPPGKPFFAFEPASMCTDGFNAFAAGQPGTGVKILGPGETLAVWYELSVHQD